VTGPPPAPRPWINRPLLARLVADAGSASGADVGVAVRSLGDDTVYTEGPLLEGAAWSTLKVPLVMTRLGIAEVEHAATSELDAIRAAAYSAITASDNDAAARIFSAIEDRKGGLTGASHAVESELASGGSDGISVATAPPPPGAVSTWGQTTWPLTSGTEFFRQLARLCVPPSSGAAEVLDLMGKVVPDQRWGIGSASWPGSSYVGFKGGWGPLPAPGYLVRQFGIVETADGRGIAVGLIAHAGTFEDGQSVLDRLAAAVSQSVHLSRTPVASRC
jgi:hypothetical protein